MKDKIINEDGTPYEPPKNPLEEKWKKLYSPDESCNPSKCSICGRCPKGSLWESPKEDIEEYSKYLDEHLAYILKHNPSLSPLMTLIN